MYKELKDYFPDGITGDGIFKAISNISWFPGVKPGQLDTYFMLMHGEKLASKVLDNFTNEDGIVEGDNLKKLAQVIHNTYITNWEHEYKSLTVEYDPISNNDYTETYNGSASGTAGGSATDSGKVTTTNKTAGLGGSGYANDNQSETTFGTGADARKTTTTSTSSGSDQHTIHRKGLIGNIKTPTISDMLEDDIDTWSKHNFYDILCSDICKIIALSIF